MEQPRTKYRCQIIIVNELPGKLPTEVVLDTVLIEAESSDTAGREAAEKFPACDRVITTAIN